MCIAYVKCFSFIQTAEFLERKILLESFNSILYLKEFL